MKRKRYSINDVSLARFYQLPKFLFEGDLVNLSNDARVLYSLLKDRHDLSIKNNWVNANNDVYILFTREDMQISLRLSDKTITKSMRALKEFGLIEEERLGLGKPNMIFLLYTDVNGTDDIEHHRYDPYDNSIDSIGTADFSQGDNTTIQDSDDLRFRNRNIGYTASRPNSTIQEPENLRFRNRRIYDSEIGDSTTQDTEILRPIKTNSNKTNNNDTFLSINQSKTKREEAPGPDGIDMIDQKNMFLTYRDKISKNIEYELLCDIITPDQAGEVLHLMCDVVCDKNNTIRVGRNNVSADVVRERFLSLNRFHVEYVIECLNNTTTRIGNIRAYMITALYNAPATMGSHYVAAVNRDFDDSS